MKSKRGDEVKFHRCKVLSKEFVAPDKVLLVFEKPFDFKAGQVVNVFLTNEADARIYSICSGDGGAFVQILFDVKMDGVLTPQLALLETGDYLHVSLPYGSFLPVSKQPMFWIATGTGIAPFYSMLKSGYRPLTLLHGAAQTKHFYFENEFGDAMADRYVQCYTGEASAGSYIGRVSKWLAEQPNLPLDCKYYLCGRALMVVDVRDLLIAKGVPFANIVSEIFF